MAMMSNKFQNSLAFLDAIYSVGGKMDAKGNKEEEDQQIIKWNVHYMKK